MPYPPVRADRNGPEVTHRIPIRKKDNLRHVRKITAKLAENTVKMKFDFKRAVRGLRQSQEPAIPPTKPDTWEDDISRKAISSDGHTLVAYIPGLLQSSMVERLNTKLMAYAKVNVPHIGKSATSADKVGKYVCRKGETAGEIRLARGWYALGQENKGMLMPSKDSMSTGTILSSTMQLYQELTPVSQRVNEAIYRADPDFHANLVRLREAQETKHPVMKAFNAVDPLLFEGRELLFNRKSGLHTDSQDPLGAYAGLLAAGSFTGGYVHLPQLNLRDTQHPEMGRFTLARIGFMVGTVVCAQDPPPPNDPPHHLQRTPARPSTPPTTLLAPPAPKDGAIRANANPFRRQHRRMCPAGPPPGDSRKCESLSSSGMSSALSRPTPLNDPPHRFQRTPTCPSTAPNLPLGPPASMAGASWCLLLEIACDTILSGKAKVMIAGGFDDISNLRPTEMSRLATTSRAGFMEAQGTGVHIIMNAKTALELGAPIRGILAFSSTSTDKAGRSVPAPGKGALRVAREVPSKHPLPILDVAYRSRQVSFCRT
ncbi:hypothetical protein FPV67DRAFT_1677684 [Lyophyllum atratum]|nr:hypothetical protein FPV67DRAFT_1677684 [Lyophyllum atratum]